MSRSTTAATRVAVAVLTTAVCALAAQSASAAWYVAGTELAGSAAIATTATVAEPIKLKAGGVTVECSASSATITGGEIKASNKIAANSIAFKECKSTTGTCTVSPTTIATSAVLAELTEQTLEDVATLIPKKSPFATIKYEGAECALAGTLPLTGKAAIQLPFGNNQEETLQEAQLKVLEKSGELKLGSSAAELEGAAQFKLASGLWFDWSKFNPSKEFFITVDNQKLTNLVKVAKVTITATKAAAKVEAIVALQRPAAQFVTNGRPLCEGEYPNAKEKCTFEVEYVGNQQAGAFIELNDAVGDTLLRTIEAKP
jgi:hypothetical protein